MSKQIEFGGLNKGTWGTVKTGRKGWTVETHSRIQGTRTGTVVHVPFAIVAHIKPTDDLRQAYSECVTNGEYIQYVASSDPRCTLRRRGIVVQ